MIDQEKIALAIEASKNTTALLEAAGDIDKVTAAADRASARTSSMAKAADTANAATDRISPKARSAANAMTVLSQAAIMGQGSMAGMANAAGLAVSSLAELSNSTKLVGLASGLGAAVAALGIMVALYEQMGARAKEVEQHDYDRMLHNAHTAQSQREILATLQQQTTQLIDHGSLLDQLGGYLKVMYGVGWGPIVKSMDRAFALSEQIKDTQAEEARAARDRAIEYQKGYATQAQALALETELAKLRATSVDSLARQTYEQKLQIDAQLADRVRQINLTYEQRDADGNIIKLTAEQVAQRADLIAKAREAAEAAKAEADATATQTRLLIDQAAAHRLAQGADSTDDYQDRIRQIEEERDAAIRSGESRVLAEAEAQQKIRQLQLKRFDEAKQGYAAMSQAAILHGTVIGKAAGLAARAIAIYEMIPQAKKDVQMGKSEAAMALKDFATPGMQAAGALHLLASGAFFSAAAFGFAEAAGLGGGGGGGGSGAGGGGGGSGPSSASTFEPVGSSAGGGVTINLITRDPYGREAISQTLYELNRSQVLKRPIPIAPTTGLVVAGAH